MSRKFRPFSLGAFRFIGSRPIKEKKKMDRVPFFFYISCLIDEWKGILKRKKVSDDQIVFD